jgi:hypothetical protein
MCPFVTPMETPKEAPPSSLDSSKGEKKKFISMQVTFCYVIIHETLGRHIPIITDITQLSLGLIDEWYLVDIQRP